MQVIVDTTMAAPLRVKKSAMRTCISQQGGKAGYIRFGAKLEVHSRSSLTLPIFTDPKQGRAALGSQQVLI